LLIIVATFGYMVYTGSFSAAHSQISKSIPEKVKKQFSEWGVKNNKVYASKEEEE